MYNKQFTLQFLQTMLASRKITRKEWIVSLYIATAAAIIGAIEWENLKVTNDGNQ
jgi:hypothetical protein